MEKWIANCIILIYLSLPLINAIPATVNGRYCGTKVCSIHEFCSNIHNQCENCDNICKDSSHNYDREACNTHCQDHLNSQHVQPISHYEDDIRQIQKQQEIILIVLIIFLVMYLIKYGIKVIKMIKKKSCITFSVAQNNKPITIFSKTEQPTNGVNPKNGRDEIDRTSNVFSVSGVEGSTVQTISTPISTRYPAENSTTEYSYDNAALQVTPGTEKPKGTTSTFGS